jgi:AF2212-like
MKKVVKGKYIDGAVRLPEDYSLNENADVYIIIEEKEEKNLLEETFGIWIDEPDYLEKLREAGEDRIKRLGIN